MKVAQKNSTNPNTVSVAPPHPPNIPNIEPFPLRTASPMIVRYCYSARIKLFRTRKLFGILQLTRIHQPHVDYTAAAYDYVVDNSTATVELLGKQSHFTSPSYRLLVYIYLLH